MAPMIAMAAVAVVSGVVQYYQAEKARKANQAELDKIKDLYHSLIPPNYDLSIDAPPELHEDHLQQPKYAEQLSSPEFVMTRLTPHNLARVGRYVPEVTRYIHENAPQLLTESEHMQKGRDAQLKALDRYRQIAENDFDPQFQAMVTKAAREAQQEAKSANDSILMDAARRGTMNSGLLMALQSQAGSQAMDRQASMNMDAAAQAYQNRINALQSSADLGGSIRESDINLRGRNADIINAFNQRLQAGQQGVENIRAATLNDAQRYNLGEDQRISDENARTANQYDIMHQGRLDDITRFNYGARVDQQSRNDRIERQKYEDARQQLAYNNSIKQALADWAARQKANQNALRSRMYQDQVAKVGGSYIPMQMQMNTQNAQDINQAIQGISNVAYQGGQSWMDHDKEERDWGRQQDLEEYKRTGQWRKTEG